MVCVKCHDSIAQKRNGENAIKQSNRHKRTKNRHAENNPAGRWRKLTDLDTPLEPADMAEEIIDNIEAGLQSFRAVAASLAR